MNNDWLDDLRMKMEDHAEEVPEGLWDDIEDELFRDEDGIQAVVPAAKTIRLNRVGKKSLLFLN